MHILPQLVKHMSQHIKTSITGSQFFLMSLTAAGSHCVFILSATPGLFVCVSLTHVEQVQEILTVTE